jgi:hypothetical protein
MKVVTEITLHILATPFLGPAEVPAALIGAGHAGWEIGGIPGKCARTELVFKP